MARTALVMFRLLYDIRNELVSAEIGLLSVIIRMPRSEYR